MFNKPEIVISSILNWSFQITFKLRENLTFRCWEFNFPSLMAVSITVQSTSKVDELVSRREKMTPLGKPENWLSNPCHCEQSKKLVEMSVTEMSVVFVCSVQTGDLTCPGGWPVWLLSRFTDGLWGSLSFDEENVALNWDVIVVWTPITTSTLSPILSSHLSLSLPPLPLTPPPEAPPTHPECPGQAPSTGCRPPPLAGALQRVMVMCEASVCLVMSRAPLLITGRPVTRSAQPTLCGLVGRPGETDRVP